MREPVGYLWTEKANGEKSLRFDPPADLPYNREHWEWEPVYVCCGNPLGLPSGDFNRGGDRADGHSDDSGRDLEVTEPKLLGCPFCGGTNLKTGGDDKVVGVWCLTCQAAGPNHYGSREWNDRAIYDAMLTASPECGWLSVETAPKDEDVLLGWWETWPQKRWVQEVSAYHHTRSGSLHSSATHWQRLPSPPASKQEVRS